MPSVQRRPFADRVEGQLPDQRCAIPFSLGQFGRGLLGGRVVGTPEHDAAEYGSDGRKQEPRVECEGTEQDRGKQNGAGHQRDAADENKFAAAFQPSGDVVDLRFEALDLVVRVAFAVVIIVHEQSIHDVRVPLMRR